MRKYNEKNIIKREIFYIYIFILQLIYVFAKEPCVDDMEIKVSCKEKPSNIILVLDGQILPYEYIDGYCIYKFDKEVTNSEDSSLVLYNFKNLTSANIEL